MTKIKSFYLNKNKIYKTRELITNWTLTFSLTGLVTFLTLTVVYGNFLAKEEFYTQTTLVDGTIIESAKLGSLGNFLLFAMFTMFFLVFSFVFSQSKWELRSDRKCLEAKQGFKDAFPKDAIKLMPHKMLLDLTKDLGKAKIIAFSKNRQKQINSLNTNQLRHKILEALYPRNTKIIIHKTINKNKEPKGVKNDKS